MATQVDLMEQPPMPARWRMIAALVMVGLSFGSTLFIPVVLAMPLSAETKATLSGLLFIGIPQVFMLLAVALVGKSGFNYIKQRVFGAVKELAPAKSVSRTRYTIGLVMFVLPFLLALVTPYATDFWAGFEAFRIQLGLAGDLLLLASLFVLGGDFWDKIRSLFVHDAKAQFAPR